MNLEKSICAQLFSFSQFRLKLGRSGGVRADRTEHTKLFSRTFAGSGLTKRRASRFSWFSEILEFQCPRGGPQNLPFCPGSPHNNFILFLRYFRKSWKSTCPTFGKTRSCESSREKFCMVRALLPDTPRPPQFQPEVPKNSITPRTRFFQVQ